MGCANWRTAFRMAAPDCLSSFYLRCLASASKNGNAAAPEPNTSRRRDVSMKAPPPAKADKRARRLGATSYLRPSIHSVSACEPRPSAASIAALYPRIA